MRIAYLDCFAGISGDMFLGSLLDAGVDAEIFHHAAKAMEVGATLRIERVDRSGIQSTKVNVLESGHPAEAPAHKLNFPEQRAVEGIPLQRQPETQHRHKIGHAHTYDSEPAEPHSHEHQHQHSHEHQHQHSHEHQHSDEPEHGHSHGRSLTAIRKLISDSKLDEAVKQTAIHTFELLGSSEAKIHNVPIDQIHFHEVGAVDAIVDIVCASAGIHALNIDKWVSSPVNVGGGMVDCAHGRFPVPAPATADLLRGFPTYSADLQKELVTPTGAAILRALFEEKSLTFGPQPAMSVEQIGYGAGSRNPAQFPNVLRLSIGTYPDLHAASHATGATPSTAQRQTVTVLETAVDDLSPQLVAQVAESALALGALDAMLTPVIMKKGRPGTLISILCEPASKSVFEQLLLRETTTLGIRIRQDERTTLAREFVSVSTPFGDIRIKLGICEAETINANPEFEDCRRAAHQHNVPVKQVQQAAVASYLNFQQSSSRESRTEDHA